MFCDLLFEYLTKDTSMQATLTELIDGPWPTKLKLETTSICADTILQHLPPSYGSRSLNERFLDAAFGITWCAMKLEVRKALLHSDACRLVGASIRGPKVARFKGRVGQTYLSCAAQWIGRMTHYTPSQALTARTRDWLAFATDLARDGADLSVVFKGLTPLHVILFFWKRQHIEDNGHVHRGLTRWLHALRAGGVALNEYGSGEQKVIQTQGRSFNYNFDLLFHSVTIGDNPERWILKLSSLTRMEVFQLHQPPGAWPSSPRVSNVVPWRPSPAERGEGGWTLVSTRTLVSQPISIPSFAMQTGEYLHFVEQTQDDHSPIALRVPSRRHPSLERRSASQPPALRRREAAYCTNSIARYEYVPWSEASGYNRYWLTACHICPMDSRLRFDCFLDQTSGESYYHGDHYFTSMSLRSCMRGISRAQTFQETDEWRTWSFKGHGHRGIGVDNLEQDGIGRS